MKKRSQDLQNCSAYPVVHLYCSQGTDSEQMKKSKFIVREAGISLQKPRRVGPREARGEAKARRPGQWPAHIFPPMLRPSRWSDCSLSHLGAFWPCSHCQLAGLPTLPHRFRYSWCLLSSAFCILTAPSHFCSSGSQMLHFVPFNLT